MLSEQVSFAFPRRRGLVPRASVLCYCLAVLHAAIAVSWGIYEGDARSIGIGVVAATAAFGLWIAIGTGLALLAEIADRGTTSEVAVLERTLAQQPPPPVPLFAPAAVGEPPAQ
jgi:hypothetical protein